MAEIFNLRMARKQKVRAAKEKTADENRAFHGLTKAERLVASKNRERQDAAVDGHFRERPNPEDNS